MSGKEACLPICKFFRCMKKAMRSRSKRAWCTWVEGECIGPSCKFSFCVKRAMLPDGRCRFKIKRSRSVLDIEREAKEEEKKYKAVYREIKKWGDFL